MNTTGEGSDSDDELVSAARGGDRSSLEALLRRHYDRIHLLCRRMCPDRGDAEDATQEALLAIVRGLPRYDGRASFATWSHRVAVNACLDQLRRRSRRPVPIAPEHDEHDHDPRLPVDADPADQAVSAEQRSRLAEALADLPERFRVPVVLRDVAELDYAEIAELLDLRPGTVRSRIARGRARLAAALPELRVAEPRPEAGTAGGAEGNRITPGDVERGEGR